MTLEQKIKATEKITGLFNEDAGDGDDAIRYEFPDEYSEYVFEEGASNEAIIITKSKKIIYVESDFNQHGEMDGCGIVEGPKNMHEKLLEIGGKK